MIVSSRIKKWGFKQRLFEIQQRVRRVQENPILEGSDVVDLEEALQIIDYWMKHMQGEVVLPKKRSRKSVNLFT